MTLDEGAVEAFRKDHAGRATEPDGGNKRGAGQDRCRTNSRRGLVDPERRSYPPVEAVARALGILRAVNKLRIATINRIYAETGIPKPTIVRMLETLMAEGYVARDNMCGGYRITCRTEDLNSGYKGISRVIEVARPFAIELTRRIKWPIGLGVLDGDAISIQFWTGAISPFAHTNTVLGLRPDLQTSAMGRAYLAFCPDDELDAHLARFRTEPERNFNEAAEQRFRLLIERIRSDGYAIRDPRTKPYRTTTMGMPIFERGQVQALISISFFNTAVPRSCIAEQIAAPLRTTTSNIEDALSFMHAERVMAHVAPDDLEHGF
jgi:IclR family mhp operon transcriptional activator